MKSIWYPTKNTVTGFNYAAYLLLAPALLLNFMLPASFIFSIYYLFFVLRTIVLLRGATTLPIDDVTKEKYDVSKTSIRMASKIVAGLLSLMAIVIMAAVLLRGDMLTFVMALLIPMLILPPSYAEVIKLNRVGNED